MGTEIEIGSVEGKSRSVSAVWEHGLSGWWAFAWDWMERSTHPHLSLALVTIDLNVGDTSV